MRKITIHNRHFVIVPKPLRKRFSGMGDGVYIKPDGSESAVYYFKTDCLQWLPEQFTKHFRKCLPKKCPCGCGAEDGMCFHDENTWPDLTQDDIAVLCKLCGGE